MTFFQQYRTIVMTDDFNADNIVFDKPRDEVVGGSKNIKGKRIKIGYMQNGKVGELIIPTEKLYAHSGVRPTTPFGGDSEDVIGYNLPISLYKRDGDVTGRDKKFVEVFRQIIDKAKDHTVSVKKSIGQAHLEKVMLYKWDNMLYEKRDDAGMPLNDFGPTFYAKLMFSREKNMLLTKIVDKFGRTLNLDDVIGKPCDVIACIKFESVYINSNGCSLQVKISEAILDIRDTAQADNLLLSRFFEKTEPVADPVADPTPVNAYELGDDEPIDVTPPATPPATAGMMAISDTSDNEDGNEDNIEDGSQSVLPATPVVSQPDLQAVPAAPKKRQPAARKAVAVK